MNKTHTRNYLETIRDRLTKVLALMDAEPAMCQVTDLIESCVNIDEHYKLLCDEIDDSNDDPMGTTYEVGMNIEFYIEAAWWHEVSKALRELGKAPV